MKLIAGRWTQVTFFLLLFSPFFNSQNSEFDQSEFYDTANNFNID